MGAGGLGKAPKKRMGHIGLGTEFRVKLAGHIPRMPGNLDEFDQISLGIDPANPQTGFFQSASMGVVELVPVSMAFPDLSGVIGFLGEGTGGQLAGVVA
jgi:hypothetical protein